MTNYELILLRHGESEWNAKNLFTGWVDVRLSEKGEAEASHGGSMLAERGLLSVPRSVPLDENLLKVELAGELPK